MIITYDPYNGVYCRDGEINDNVNIIIETKEDRHVASELIIEALRVAVKMGRIKPDEISFKFKDDIISVNKEGNLSNFPNGFLDTHQKLLFDLLPIVRKFNVFGHDATGKPLIVPVMAKHSAEAIEFAQELRKDCKFNHVNLA